MHGNGPEVARLRDFFARVRGAGRAQRSEVLDMARRLRPELADREAVPDGAVLAYLRSREGFISEPTSTPGNVNPTPNPRDRRHADVPRR
ncbi:MAG: hypothetical protein U1F43_29275 [Myxococcota bacterium]